MFAADIQTITNNDRNRRVQELKWLYSKAPKTENGWLLTKTGQKNQRCMPS